MNGKFNLENSISSLRFDLKKIAGAWFHSGSSERVGQQFGEKTTCTHKKQSGSCHLSEYCQILIILPSLVTNPWHKQLVGDHKLMIHYTLNNAHLIYDLHLFDP